MNNYGRILFYGENKFMYCTARSTVIQMVYFRYMDERREPTFPDGNGKFFFNFSSPFIFSQVFSGINLSPDKAVCNLYIGRKDNFLYACHSSPIGKRYHTNQTDVFSSLERVVNGCIYSCRILKEQVNVLKKDDPEAGISKLLLQIDRPSSFDLAINLWGGKKIWEVGA